MYQSMNVFFFPYHDRKLTQKLHSIPDRRHLMTATTHGTFILKHNLSFDFSLISQACSMAALCGADLSQLLSSRFIFPPSTGVWSALSSAQTPWCSSQSIKSISVSCCLGDTGWQPEWAPPPLSPLPEQRVCVHWLLDFSPIKVDRRMSSHFVLEWRRCREEASRWSNIHIPAWITIVIFVAWWPLFLSMFPVCILLQTIRLKR